MKLLNRLSKRFQILLFGLLAIAPLLAISSYTFAADDESVDFSQAELDQMLAPIALYPDTLLSQVLIAATYPLEVVQADRWVRSNKDLKTEDALKFAENKDWDPSVKALVAFPDVLQRMSENVDWTQRLGDAFLGDEDEVMDAVQRLRKRAYATGNLEKAQHISVEEDNDNIVIEPAQERVVYVPVYDTRVVYGNWWWPEYPPVYWHYPSSYTYVSGFYWGSSIYVGPTYFYSSCHWRDRRVVVIDRHTHYSGNPRFYTGRSIVRHEGARAWRHDPVHRHGVGYYNNSQREIYGGRHDTRRSDREYREQFRDRSRQDQRRDHDNANRDSRDPRQEQRFNNGPVRTEVKNEESNRPGNFDRADRVRDRLNQRQATGESNSGNDNEGRFQNRIHRGDQRDEVGQTPTINRENNSRPRDIERVRPNIQQRAEVNRGESNDGGRAFPERHSNNEQARREFSPPASRTPEQRVSPAPTMERREEPPRRAEVFQSQRMESRNEQRAERMNSRGAERHGDQDRVR